MSDTNKGEQDQPGLVGYASKIVAAYVGNNTVASDDLPDLIRLVHDSLSAVAGSEADKPQLKPAVPVAKSISDNFLICLEDGKKFKSLKRHLRPMTCRRKNTGRNGTCRPTIQWLRRDIRVSVQSLPKRWALAAQTSKRTQARILVVPEAK